MTNIKDKWLGTKIEDDYLREIFVGAMVQVFKERFPPPPKSYYIDRTLNPLYNLNLEIEQIDSLINEASGKIKDERLEDVRKHLREAHESIRNAEVLAQSIYLDIKKSEDQSNHEGSRS